MLSSLLKQLTPDLINPRTWRLNPQTPHFAPDIHASSQTHICECAHTHTHTINPLTRLNIIISAVICSHYQIVNVKGDWQAGISFGITDTLTPTHTHTHIVSLAVFQLHSQMVSGTGNSTWVFTQQLT